MAHAKRRNDLKIRHDLRKKWGQESQGKEDAALFKEKGKDFGHENNSSQPESLCHLQSGSSGRQYEDSEMPTNRTGKPVEPAYTL